MDGVGTVLPFDRPADRGGAVIDPGDLVKQPIRAEDLVQHNAGVGRRMPVQMQAKRPCRRKELVHKQESRGGPGPGFRSIPPGAGELSVSRRRPWDPEGTTSATRVSLAGELLSACCSDQLNQAKGLRRGAGFMDCR